MKNHISNIFNGPQTAKTKRKFYAMKPLAGGIGSIEIFEDIGEGFFGGVGAKEFSADLKALGDISEIHLFINSFGGQVFEGLTIFNLLKAHRATVRVFVLGIAASIASIIAMAGDEISIAANGMMMIHEPMISTFGNAEELREAALSLDRISGALVCTYVARTGLDTEKISAMMAAETWMGAKEAVEFGFADKITEELAIAAKALPEKMAENAPDWVKNAIYPKNGLGKKTVEPAEPAVEPPGDAIENGGAALKPEPARETVGIKPHEGLSYVRERLGVTAKKSAK